MMVKRIGNRIFAALIVFCMVTALLPALSNEVKAEDIKEMGVGDYVQFGQYWGDPIVWRVINKNDDGSLMLYSDKILCCKAFDANGDSTDGRDDAEGNRVKYGSNNWEKSNLREWLNSEDAFVQYSHQKPDSEHLVDKINSYDSEAGFLSNFTKAERDVIQPYEHSVILPEVDKDIRNGGSEEYTQTYQYHNFWDGEWNFDFFLESFMAAGQNCWLYGLDRLRPIKIKTNWFIEKIEYVIEDSTYSIYFHMPNNKVYELNGPINTEEIHMAIVDRFPLDVDDNQHLGANIEIINNSKKKINIDQDSNSKRVFIRDRNGEVILGSSQKENVVINASSIISNYSNSYYKNVADKVFLLDVNQLTNYIYNRGWDIKGNPTYKAVLNSEYKSSYLIDGKPWHNWTLTSGGYVEYKGCSVRVTDGLGEVAFAASDGKVGVRPAINLKAGVKTTGGEGSLSDPFIVPGEEGFESPAERKDIGNVPLTSNYVLVADADSKEPISGASVKIGNNVVVSDKNGIAEFDSITEGNYDLNLEAANYQRHSCIYDLKLGNVGLFYIKQDKDLLNPYITKVSLNDGTRDYDLFREVKECRQILRDSDIKPEDYCSIKMEAESRGKKVKYILTQGGNSILESETGQFDSVVIGKKFSPGSTIYAIVKSEDGTRSEPVATNLSVFSSRLDGCFGSEGSKSLRVGKKFGTSVSNNIPIIGGTDIDVGVDAIPITYTEKGNTFKFAIGFKDAVCTGENYNKMKKAVDDAKNARADYKEMKNILKTVGGKVTQMSVKPEWKGDMDVVGYIEGIKQYDGSLVVTQGSIFVKAEAKIKNQMQYVIGPVPVYLEVGAGFRFETLAEVKKLILDSSEIIFNTDLKLVANLQLGGGVGVAKVITVGALGEAELEYLIKHPENYSESAVNIKDEYYTKVSLTGKMSLKAQALFFEAKKEIAKGTWVLYEDSPSSKPSVRMAPDCEPFDMYDEASYSIMPRDYINRPSEWIGDHQKVNRSSGVRLSPEYTNKDVKTLQTNIYPDAQPQLAMVGDKKVMVWTADNSKRTSVNRTMIVYSIYDDVTDTWSVPVAVDDDNTADFYPSLASDSGNLYLVWQNSNKVFDDSITLSEAAASGEIAVAKFNADKNVFENVSKLTNNSKIDTQPQIAVEGDKAFVVWSSNSENDLFGNSGRNTIYYSELKDGVWSSPAELAGNLNTVTSLDAGFMDNSFRAAYVTDQDNNMETIDDRDIFIATPGKETIKLTDNQTIDSAPVFADFNGANALYWYNDSNILYLTSITGTPSKVFKEAQMGIRDDFEVVNNSDGKTAVIWTGAEEGKTEINTAIYDKDKAIWSEDVKISDLGSRVQFPSGIFDKNGNFNIAFNKLTATENGVEQSDLCTIKVTPSYNIAVSSVSLDSENLVPGTEMPLEIEVENKGELRVDKLKIDINGGTSTSNSVIETLLPGETKTINTVLKVDNFIKKCNYTVKVTPFEGEEFDLSDNTKEFTTGYTDIALDIDQYTIGNSEVVTVNLSNLSHVGTGAVLKVREDSIDGKVIDTKTIGNVKYGANLSYVYEIDKTKLIYNEGIKQLYFTVESTEEEVSTGDNSDCIVLSKPASDESTPEIVYGDVNGDGVVNSIDFAHMRKYLIGMVDDFPSTNGKIAADVTGDGSVDSIDFAYMRKYLIGMIDKFPAVKS